MSTTVRCIVALLAATASAAAQPPPAPPTGGLGLAQKAMTHELLVSRDPTFVALQYYAHELYIKGLSVEEIRTRTSEKWREWRSLKATAGGGEWNAPAEALVIARSIGGYASDQLEERIRAGAGGTAVENWGIDFVEARLRGGAVPRAARRWVAAKSHRPLAGDPAAEIFAALSTTYRNQSTFRTAWDGLFLTHYGFTPASTDADVVASYPGFEGNERIEALVANRDDTTPTELLGVVTRATDEIAAATQETLGTLNARRTATHFTVEAEAGRRQQEKRRQVDVANAYTVANVASTMLGLIAPEVGRPIAVTTTAMIEVNDAVERLHAAERVGSNLTLARMAFTGNVVGAVVKLFTGLFSSGPSSHEVILQELGKLRRQIATLRRQMHLRFNAVHDHLSQIHAALAKGIDLLGSDHEALGRNQERIKRLQRVTLDEVRQVERQVRQVIGRQGDLFRLMLQLDDILSVMDRAALAPCHREYRPDDGDVMTLTTFLDCLSVHAKLAQLLTYEQVVVSDPTTQAQMLTEQPERSLNMAYQQFRVARRSLGPEVAVDVATLPDAVVSPQGWLRLANLVDDIITAHPEHEVQNELLDYSMLMGTSRSAFFWAQDALQADIEADRNDEQSAVGTIIDEAYDDAALETLVQGFIDEFYGNPDLYAGRRNAAGEPEIRIQEGPYAWRALGEFESGVPSWFDPKWSSTCAPSMDIGGRQVNRVRPASNARNVFSWLFRGGRLGQFIHADDLAVVRAGHGTIRSCFFNLDFRGAAYKGNDRSGVQFIFEPKSDQVCGGEPHLVATYWINVNDTGRLGTDIERLLMTANGHVSSRRRLPASCHAEYVDVFAERQDSLSDFLRERLLTSTAVDAMNQRLVHADALLRRLFRFAFHDAFEQSDLIGQLVDGPVGLPNLIELITASDSPAWTVTERARAQVQALEEAIRSAEVGDALAYASGIEAVEGTSYRFIDAER